MMEVTSDPCIYTASGREIFLIAVNVDDNILAGKSHQRMKKVKRAIADKFAVKDIGELHHFLGVKIVQNKDSSDIWIGQEAYIRELLKKFEESRPMLAPVEIGSNFVKATNENDLFDKETYQSAVGSLL